MTLANNAQLAVGLLVLTSCARVFDIATIPVEQDASDVSDGQLDTVDVLPDAARDAMPDAAADAANVCTNTCDIVAQTGCCTVGEACYPTDGCVVPTTNGLDGAFCNFNMDCAKGYFCGSNTCYRICDCGVAPPATCNQPTACSTTAGNTCRQYNDTYGYCVI